MLIVEGKHWRRSRRARSLDDGDSRKRAAARRICSTARIAYRMASATSKPR
jgi:hypothetical protein